MKLLRIIFTELFNSLTVTDSLELKEFKETKKNKIQKLVFNRN